MRAIAITQTEACTRRPRKQQRPETTQITTHISEKREEQNISMGVDFVIFQYRYKGEPPGEGENLREIERSRNHMMLSIKSGCKHVIYRRYWRAMHTKVIEDQFTKQAEVFNTSPELNELVSHISH